MRRVTITGADDKVKLRELEALYVDFPFVEWGILLSKKRVGTTRYPSLRWIRKLARSEMAFSAHLCGDYARKAILDGWIAWPDKKMSEIFKRRQVNNYDPGVVKPGSFSSIHPFATILQCMSEAAFPQLVEDAKSISGSVLFDPSGGRGVLLAGWPQPPYEVPVGLAGGIGSDNIRAILDQWGAAGPDAWVDLESKARDEDDQFDLGCVRETLQEVAASGWAAIVSGS